MAGHTPWRELQRRVALLNAGVVREALDELAAAGYRPTTVEEAIRDAQMMFRADLEFATGYVLSEAAPRCLIEVEEN